MREISNEEENNKGGRKRLTQVFGVPHCPVWLLRRVDLQGAVISGSTGKALVPQPAGHVLGALKAGDASTAIGLYHLFKHMGGKVVEDLGGAGAHDEDVAGAEFDTLVGGAGLELVDGDGAAVEGVEGCALVLGVGLEVDEDGPGDDAAALVPVLEGGRVCGSRGGCCGERLLGGPEAVVGEAGGLVLVVAEAVPLAAALGVEREVVVPGDGRAVARLGVGKVEDLVLRRGPARHGDIAEAVQTPAGRRY